MAYSPNKTTQWDRTTLNDGDLFEAEFNRVYENLQHLSDANKSLQAEVDLLKKAARMLGEKFWLDEYRPPSAEFPAYCISEPDSILSSGNWPDLVPYLYNRPLRFRRGGDDRTDFRVVGWSVSDSVATLTFPITYDFSSIVFTQGSNELVFSDTTGLETGMAVAAGTTATTSSLTYYVISVDHIAKKAVLDQPWENPNYTGPSTFTYIENNLLKALEEDLAVPGVGKNPRSITIPAAIGTIPAGDFEITEVSSASKGISFNCLGVSDGSGTETGFAQIFPNRVAGMNYAVRMYSVQGRTFVTPGDEFGEIINGLRRRDRFQGHFHNMYGNGTPQSGGQWPGGMNTVPGQYYGLGAHAREAVIDDQFNDHPRHGPTTDPRSEANYAYIWGATFIP